MKTSSRTFAVLMAIGLAIGVAACGSNDDSRPDNQRPTVFLDVPPIAQRLPYATTFHWAGADTDGVVDHFEYAIDIPKNITMDQIDDPDDASVDWEATTATEMRFVFSTPDPDTIVAGGTVIVRETDVGDHCFYVRAVDDEGLPSKAEFYCFTAENVHPRTAIDVSCFAAMNLIQTHHLVRLTWTGLDPDGPEPARKPAYYEWKKIPVSSVLALPLEDVTAIVHGAGAGFDWVRSDTEGTIVEFESPGGYLVVVRAVDENSGREDRFRRGVNAVVANASNLNPAGPEMFVTFAGVPHRFPGDGVWNLEIPAGPASLTFDLALSSDSYCGFVTGVGCGLGGVDDIPLQAPSGSVTCDLQGHTGGLQVVTFVARDDLGQKTVGTLVLNLVGFPRDRDVLYVDDYRLSNQGGITDAMMDARVQAMLEDIGVPGFFKYDVWGDGDLNQIPEELRLSDLARYKLVLWSVEGNGVTAFTGLSHSTQCSRVLQVYSQAGGAVWIYGQSVFGTFQQMGTTACRANLNYSETMGLFPDAGTFSCDFLHLCNGDIRRARLSPQVNGLVRALPTAEGVLEMFPELEIDATLTPLPYIPFVDALFEPALENGLDTLYAVRAPSVNSTFNNKPVAFRYADPNPESSQGPVAVFGFPFHLLTPGSAASRTGVHGMARSMMEWFRSHEGGGS